MTLRNRVQLVGNLGSDPELKTTENGRKLARFSLATNENYQDSQGNWQTDTQWHNIVVWGKTAEQIADKLKKGHEIMVEGKLSHRSWKDNEGQERRSTDVIMSSFLSFQKNNAE